jgi:hypothetical protein
MRFFFHVSNGFVTAEDNEGLELPSCLAALDEGGKIAQELLNDPDTMSFHGGVVNIVGSGGWLFISLPISNPGEFGSMALH